MTGLSFSLKLCDKTVSLAQKTDLGFIRLLKFPTPNELGPNALL